MGPLEDEILGVLWGATHSRRDCSVVLARLGLDGTPPKTLQVLGDAFGVTRERIRQMQQRVARRLAAMPMPMMPTFEESLTLVQANLPCRIEDVPKLLTEAGLSSGGVTGDGLVAAASFFGLETPFTVEATSHQRLLIDRSTAGSFKKARQTARKLVRSRGVTTVAEVADVLHSDLPENDREKRDDAVRAALMAEPCVVWLDQTQRWLWVNDIPEGKNRLLNDVAKVLSVAGRIEASALRSAVRRDWRLGGYAPPAPVLLALADAVPALRRIGSAVEAHEPLSREDYLSNSEYILAELLLANGAVMRSSDLQQQAAEYGVHSASFHQRMYSSPIVRKYAPGVYGLHGVEADPARVHALVGRAVRSRVLQDCGWTDSGEIWVAYKLSRNTTEVPVLGIPASVRDFVVGDHPLRDAAGRDVGVLVVNEYSAWGVGRFFRIAGAEEGDTLLMVFDLSTGVCCAHLGDESVRDEVLAD